MAKLSVQAQQNYDILQAAARATPMVHIRKAVLDEITTGNGFILNRKKAEVIAASLPSPLCAQTVIKFAMGETVNPSIFTWEQLTIYVTKGLSADEGQEVWIMSKGFVPPEGMNAVRVK